MTTRRGLPSRTVAAVMLCLAAPPILALQSAGTVQSHLGRETQRALDGSGIPASVTMHGRDATLRLDASHADAADTAIAVVAAVAGIRKVRIEGGTAHTPDDLAQNPAPLAPAAQPTPGTSTSGSRPPVLLLFASDDYRLDTDDLEALQPVAAFLRRNSGVRAIIRGHADYTGTAAANLELSRRRANAVTDHLTQSGVDPDQLVTEAYGDTRPLADDSTAEGRAANRRVEVTIEGGE